jgi:hypothetical protein
MQLTGIEIEQLRDILCGIFDRDELKVLVRVALNVDLFTAFAGPDSSNQVVVFDLITALERRNLTVALLVDAWKRRSNNDELRNFCARCFPMVLSPPQADADQVIAVVNGVDELRRRLVDPAVKKRIAAAQPSLRRIGSLIEHMQSYKELHDCLHLIQVQFFRQILETARLLRTDPSASDTLDGYLAGLRSLAVQARSSVTRLENSPMNTSGQELRWINDLEAETIAGLNRAITSGDLLSAQRATVRLKSLLVIEPPRINQVLTSTATQLPLDQMIETLTQVLESLAPEDQSAQPLRDGLAGLQQLYPRLIGQISRHMQWQRVEQELWQADDELNQGSPESREEFTFFWPAIQSDVQSTGKRTGRVVGGYGCSPSQIGLFPLPSSRDASLFRS